MSTYEIIRMGVRYEFIERPPNGACPIITRFRSLRWARSYMFRRFATLTNDGLGRIIDSRRRMVGLLTAMILVSQRIPVTDRFLIGLRRPIKPARLPIQDWRPKLAIGCLWCALTMAARAAM